MKRQWKQAAAIFLSVTMIMSGINTGSIYAADERGPVKLTAGSGMPEKQGDEISRKEAVDEAKVREEDRLRPVRKKRGRQ